jgi:hypothetical protein
MLIAIDERQKMNLQRMKNQYSKILMLIKNDKGWYET